MKTRTKKSVLSLRKPIIAHSKSALLLSTTALLVSASVNAQQNDEPILLDTMHIEERTSDTNPYAEAGAPYKAKISGDKRHVKPLAETPQTITVLTQTAIQESGQEDLRDILAAQPGITLGTGENGNAFGDRYVIRGHEARSDVFVDGIRDPGMTTRESFAVEQIEITKGPSSTFAGRGSTGGAINGITKQASTEYTFNKIQAGLGTDDYSRIALDSNVKINDDAAIRANLLYTDKDVAKRAPASKERTGVALSGAYQATEKLALVADFYYLDAKDKPDLGSYIDRDTGVLYDDIPVYVQDEDFLNSEVATYTFRADYQLNDNVSFQNSMRYGTTENGYVVTGAGGATRDATDPVAPGADTITFSTHQGWQEVDYFVNQLNTYVTANLADMKHEFIFSVEYSDMGVLNGAYSNVNTGATNCIIPGRSRPGDPPAAPEGGYCGTDANGNAVDNINSLLGREITKGEQDSDYNIETISLSVMDTIDVTNDLSVFVGVRMDSFDYTNLVAGRDGDPSTLWAYDDVLWNGHAGVVYQLAEQGNIYATYSTSTNINGGESDVGGNCGYGGLCGDVEEVGVGKPESVENIELGTKWDLFDDKLLVTAAIFHITKSDVMEGADYDTTGTQNTGENVVKGIEVSVAGNITDDLSVIFGASLMDSEITKGYETDPTARDYALGGRLANFADESAYLQLRYQLTPEFAFGGSAKYSSEVYTGQPDTAANDNFVPSYTVLDLFATYNVSKQLNVRLNVGNVANKEYYLTAYRGGTFAYLGALRSAKVTVSYDF
ncbi:MAG: TonB-dependent receptor [Colwellia sp.]|nr:TonB-dependent receptor [Colwellia sp.]